MPVTVTAPASALVLFDATLAVPEGAEQVLSADAASWSLEVQSVGLSKLSASRQLMLASFPYPMCVTEPDASTVFGSFTIGQAPNQTGIFTLSADRVAVTVTAQAAALQTDAGLELVPLDIEIQPAALTYGRKVTAGAISLGTSIAYSEPVLTSWLVPVSLAVQPVNLIYSSSSIKLIAETVTLALSAQEVELTGDRPLEAAPGSFVLTGYDATFAIGNRALTAETGAFSITGGPTGNNLRAERGVFTYSGLSADLGLNADTFWQRVDDTPEVWTKISV